MTIKVKVNDGNGMKTVFTTDNMMDAKAVANAYAREDDLQASIYADTYGYERLTFFTHKDANGNWMLL